MLQFFRRIGLSGRKAQSVSPVVRLTLELLEGRDLPAPLAPTGLLATGASASAIALTWNAPPDATVTGYDVFERIRHVIHQPKGSSRAYYTFNLIASNLTSTSDTVTGLATGSFHTYLVTSVNSTGQSPYSAPATGETWVAPSFSNGPTAFLLSSGAVWSGPVNATAGLTTQVKLLVSGNPLTFSVVSGPASASIDPQFGFLTYTPATSDAGPVSITVTASNALGAVTQTIQFNVAAPNPNQAKPTLMLFGTLLTYDSQYHQAWASAVGTDGVTPVSGTFAFAYNGSSGFPRDAGTYTVLATFTSSDPNYASATVLTTLTISKATPAFNYLSSPTIAVGTATTTVSGNIAAGTATPTGDIVFVSINGATQEATVDANGNFSASFATSALPVGSYAITYSLAGDANFNAPANGSSTLNVIPTAPPQVTLNPSNATVTAGDVVSFTATATGSPNPSVQWQVSTDGGLTFTNITSNTSAQTTTLYFTTSASQNGYLYRAVFTSSAGTAISTVATLTVEIDVGGGD
ncbi:MAG: Ig-like domain repeat protein [Planctomycetes bacterium]|nr:Ig-like domain repeat protein [Planctomycetota bacterium]